MIFCIITANGKSKRKSKTSVQKIINDINTKLSKI